MCYIPTMLRDRWKSRLKWAGLAAGVALVIAAIVVASTEVKLEHLRQAQPWQIGVLLIAVGANLVLTTTLWWAVTLSMNARPPVPLGKMFALIAASGLLNYLPLWPGRIGRAVYLKVKHALPIRQSVLAFVLVMALSGLVLGAAAAITALVPRESQLGMAIVAAVLATFMMQVVVSRTLPRRTALGWLWTPLRIADLLVTALRLWVAFRVVGHAISYSDAVLAASAGMFVALLGITPNGLGLREWAIAGVTRASAGPVGLAAAIIDRGVEAVVLTVTGLWALQKVSLKQVGDEARETAQP